MKKATLLAAAASFFKHYPSEKEIHFTRDEQAFFSKNDAINHGNGLREKKNEEAEITTVTREEAEAAAAEAAKPATDPKVEALNKAKKMVAVYEKTVAKAKEAYEKAAKKAEAKPEDEKLKGNAATLKEFFEGEQKKLEQALTELNALAAGE